MTMLVQSKKIRDVQAPADLPMPFWPLRIELKALDVYPCTTFWFSGMKEATKHSYGSHLRLFCRFYQTDPEILVMFPAEHLKVLLDAYLLHLLKIAVKAGGKPKKGQFSVNSVPHYFTGLRSFFVSEHEKDISWERYENKFPERVSNNLRGYRRDEVRKLYKAADIYDKPLVLLEYCSFVRVGAIGPARVEDIMPIPEMPGLYFLKVYPDSADDFYYVLLTPEFMADWEVLKAYREKWGEKLTNKSFIICSKIRNKRQTKSLTEDAIRLRMHMLADRASLDLSNIQPNHGVRKASNTAMKNAHVDKDFKELLMGHSTGLDDVYYDVENPESREEIVVEYMKAIDTLTINEEFRLLKQVDELKEELKSAAAHDMVYDLAKENRDIKEQMMQEAQEEVCINPVFWLLVKPLIGDRELLARVVLQL